MIQGDAPRTASRRGYSAIAGVFLLIASLSPVMVATAASADPNPHSCPTEPYTGGTDHPCPQDTTTTAAGGTVKVVLTLHYKPGALDWQACGFPSSFAGTSVQLYADGHKLDGPGSTGAVTSNGCTPDPQTSLCLASGTYTFTAVNQQYAGSNKLAVNTAGCSATVAIGSTAGSSHTGLAFTGADALLLLAAAAVIIVVGYAAVRLSRRRREVT